MSESHSSKAAPDSLGSITVIEAGARFGDLTLLRPLGRGNQGVVWEALQKSVGRKVAVKILAGDSSGNEELAQRFHREAEAAGRLSHTSIVAVYGFEELGGHRLILQELVTGGSLDSLIDQRHKEREQTDDEDCRWAADICRQLADALHHAHQNNVIHRDIKPGNVLLTPDGVPKIADFGLAKVQDLFDLSQTGSLMGTPHYMSPEQVSARHQGIDARTDVYSLGAMLYRMVARQVPFSGESLQKIFMDILTRQPKPPRALQPGVSADLEAVCLKALEKEPDRRYASARALAEDLQRFLQGEPTLARPVGAVGRVARSLGHLATSTLAVIAVLVPTAWLAVDAFLRLQAKDDVRRHDWRLALVALATLVLAWPLALIARRLARNKRWAIAPACALALLLGAGAARLVRDQKADQLHHIDRDALAGVFRHETVGAVKSVAEIDRYIDHWEPRFDQSDELLVARGLLKRERPARALEWTERLLQRDAGNPVNQALLAAVQASLGNDEQRQLAEDRLLQAEASLGDWMAWEQIGSILTDMGRHAGARDAFKQAGKLPQADRDRLTIELARSLTGLCEFEDARTKLVESLDWRSDEPGAMWESLQLAIAAGDPGLAEQFLPRVEASDAFTLREKLESRVAYLRLSADPTLVGDFLRRTADSVGSGDVEHDATVLLVCGTQAFQEADRQTQDAPAWLQFSQDCLTRLVNSGGRPLEGRVSLAGTDIKLAKKLLVKDPERATVLLDEAIDQSRQGLAFDPAYWESHYNLSVALFLKAYIAHERKEAEITTEELDPILAALRDSLQYSGLQFVTLNNAAYSLVLTFGRDGDPRHLDEALPLARRAIALRQRDEKSACVAKLAERIELSSGYDTLRSVQEKMQDPAAAYASAKLALQVLNEGEPGYDTRKGTVARLLDELPNK